MPLVFTFVPPGMTREKYDLAIKKLEAAGAGKPAGRIMHVCYPDSGGLRVTDVWESQAHFDKFGETLMPILAEIGLDPGQPDVIETYNVIKG
jgi:hypothetical protein